MREISLHILDIAQNSLSAGASKVTITITAQTATDILTVNITDNGRGIDKQMLDTVTSPFTTSRKTRSVGMGLPLFKQAAEVTGGSFDIKSQSGKGTSVTASFVISSIDRVPVGNMAETLMTLIYNQSGAEIALHTDIDGTKFSFDTQQIKEQYGFDDLNDTEIQRFLKEYLQENIENINKGGLQI